MIGLYMEGGDDGEEDDEKKNPSFGDYFMHFLTIFWKVLFATIPPASKKPHSLAFSSSSFHSGSLRFQLDY